MMTQELIIEGQRADLSPGTNITLEYMSGLFEDFSKVNLSRSYTIKLPRTKRNADILDDPGNPAHDSDKARRYFSAEYYRNGIGLIGQARAYLLGATDKDYEVALIWNTSDELTALKDAGAKLTDLQGFPVLSPWKGATLATESTTAETFFASYFSGAESITNANAAPHPCVTMWALLRSIFETYRVPYSITPELQAEMSETALLVAPSHKPNLDMDIASGSYAYGLEWDANNQKWWFNDWREGWDAPYSGYGTFIRGGSSSARVFLNLMITNAAPDIYLTVEHTGSPIILKPTSPRPGVYLIDEVVDLGDIDVNDEATGYGITIHGLTPGEEYEFSYWLAQPMFSVSRSREEISIENDNRFPVAVNLPDISQMDYFRACCSVFGIAPTIRDGVLLLRRYDDVLNIAESYDWSFKLDTQKGSPFVKRDTLDGLAQRNEIVYAEDVDLPFDPTIVLTTEDATLKERAELAKLPFAASAGGSARHYQISAERNEETGLYDYTVETIDIKPRIFTWTINDAGKRQLTFPTTLWGDGSLAKHYSAYQEAIRKPVTIEVNVRLSELDLAQLDLLRPVYIAAFGRYYSILSVQTSDTDTCKVKLIQIS